MLTQSAYVVSAMTPDHLLITVPPSSLLPPWLAAVSFAIFVVITYTTSRSVWRVLRPLKSPEELHTYVWRYRATGMGICFFSLGTFWLLSSTSGSIELDRRTNLATMRAKFTAFLPAETSSVPLSAVDEATLDGQPNARRIRLVTNDGNDLGYPLWSDRPGQTEAVQAINRFLACAGCDVSGEAELRGGKNCTGSQPSAARPSRSHPPRETRRHTP
jgi:hypothetical protein